MTFRDLKLRIRGLARRRRVESELDDELAFHLECETRKGIEAGLSPSEARRRARARFGSVALAADQCRDARGTGLVDDLARDVIYALRTFARAPLAAATIVGTVALGLGLVAVVFTFFNALYLTGSGVRDADELFVVERPPRLSSGRVWIPFTRPEYEGLRQETNVFSDVAAMIEGSATRIDGRTAGVDLVSGNFFAVLGVQAEHGRTLLPSDDERGAGRRVIVLSERGARRLFGADPAVIGTIVPINGEPYEVVGVMPAGFGGLGFVTPDYWAPLSLAPELPTFRGRSEDAISLPTIIGRLKPGLPQGDAQAALARWALGRPDLKRAAGQPVHIRLRPIDDLSPEIVDGLKRFAPLFFTFGLILVIGCANVANLLLARGVARQREIGIRLSLGASRRRIVRQLLTEGLLLALLAALCGFTLSRLFVESAVRVLAATIPADSPLAGLFTLGAPDADWRVALFILAGAVAATLVFALLPALQATRLELIRTMRGEIARDARPQRARHALVAVQISASVLLVIGSIVFLRGALSAAATDVGLRTSDTLMVDAGSESAREGLLQTLSAHPLVADVAASAPGPMGFLQPTDVESSGRQTVAGYQFVSPGYLSLLDVEITRGRGFRVDEHSPGAGVALVSERTAAALWPSGEAVGQVVRFGVKDPGALAAAPRAAARAYTVIGVVREIGGRIQTFGMSFAQPDVYLPIDLRSAATAYTVRAHGDPERARRTLLEDLTRVDPSLGGIRTMRTMVALEASVLQIAFGLTLVLGALALLLTLSGLFSVLSYVVEQRRQEIGVRMALGATARHVIRLVLVESAWPVAVGAIAGAALALGIARVLMTTPAATTIGSVVRVFDPVAYAVSLVCIAAACALAAWIPARRAAGIDPMITLREQ